MPRVPRTFRGGGAGHRRFAIPTAVASSDTPPGTRTSAARPRSQGPVARKAAADRPFGRQSRQSSAAASASRPSAQAASASALVAGRRRPLALRAARPARRRFRALGRGRRRPRPSCGRRRPWPSRGRRRPRPSCGRRRPWPSRGVGAPRPSWRPASRARRRRPWPSRGRRRPRPSCGRRRPWPSARRRLGRRAAGLGLRRAASAPRRGGGLGPRAGGVGLGPRAGGVGLGPRAGDGGLGPRARGPASAAAAFALARATYVRGGYPSPFDRVRRASPVALVWSVLAVAAGGILGLQLPETRWSAVEPSKSAIELPEFGALVGLDGHPPLARPDPALLRKVADPPSVLPLVARSTPRGSRIEGAAAGFRRSVNSAARRWAQASCPEHRSRRGISLAFHHICSRRFTRARCGEFRRHPSAGCGLFRLSSPAPAPPRSSPAETSGFAATYVPVNAVARAPDRELEARAIQNVLGRYRIAFNNLDAGAALAVWPTVNEKTLAKAFEGLESHDLSFQSCQIELFSVLAEAACSGSARYVPKVGSRTPRAEARRWRFSLRKASGGWLIDSVDAR